MSVECENSSSRAFLRRAPPGRRAELTLPHASCEGGSDDLSQAAEQCFNSNKTGFPASAAAFEIGGASCVLCAWAHLYACVEDPLYRIARATRTHRLIAPRGGSSRWRRAAKANHSTAQQPARIDSDGLRRPAPPALLLKSEEHPVCCVLGRICTRVWKIPSIA